MRMMLLGLLCFAGALARAVPPPRDVTFLSVSDCHYREPDHKLGSHNHLNRASVQEMNAISGRDWPAALGGGKIARPRGAVVLGDCIDDGDRKSGGREISAEQYSFFLEDFGLTGSEGLLKYPSFEGWGNHDGPPQGKEKTGFSFQREIRKRNLIRKQKGLISNLSSNGLHASWDWDDVHFVQLNLYPADRQRAGIHYSPVWHDPQDSLSFLKQDLAGKVGDSGRPVVLMSHCGFDTDWWAKEDWKALYDGARAYNVILYLYGHTGTGILKWAPEGEDKRWNVINDGQMENGFFVIRITEDRLCAAYRFKAGMTSSKQSEGKVVMNWPGTWDWKFLLDIELAGVGAAKKK